VKHLHAAGVLRDDFRKPPVSHRAFVEVCTDQRYSALLVIRPAILTP
jgi:hypothetical protein